MIIVLNRGCKGLVFAWGQSEVGEASRVHERANRGVTETTLIIAKMELDQNLDLLNKLRVEVTQKAPKLAKYFTYQMMRQTEEAGEPLSVAVNGKFCRHCLNVLVPGVNADIKVCDRRKGRRRGRTRRREGKRAF